MTESSPVADHCSTYSLNDSKDAEYKTPCNHTHDRVCSSCEELKEVLLSIKNVLNEVKGNEDELEDLKYDHNHAVQEIQSWKAHQLRSVRQDKARSEILDALDESSVFITQDWAMKFLPQKYRESQSDWFGKRGISWHISVAVRKKHNVLQSQSFVHIAETSDQDSFLVVRIIEHVLRTLKAEHPELQTAFLRQDNAGCYHSALMLVACSLMAKRTGIRVGRVDFSDPQGGKGACDRQAASIKAHVRRFINEGHDVNSAQDFKEAMMSSGGIKGVRVVLVDAYTPVQKTADTQVKWEGVSFQNNFCYSEDGITTWKAYKIGEGKLLHEGGVQIKGKAFIYLTVLPVRIGYMFYFVKSAHRFHEI